MTITKTADGNKLCLALAGRLDTMTSPELEEVISEGLADVQELTLDFKNLEYISSAGLRVLLKASKLMNKRGGLTVTNVNDMVMQVFEISGFTELLNIK